ncbi:GNAT family N-acetyltransferase [Chelatococcus reniformis]|uniref:N-acetyltransferase n=1 Tax=Chelatococcus reniformis TaxID=1494448 RepID=A0A916X9D0_9HYPH|nr:GNAT family N-acetyltransferase [Chelatococcus reniformis]GGC56999.1 N-acetyltransferase [Chelatococcus reniformis]
MTFDPHHDPATAADGASAGQGPAIRDNAEAGRYEMATAAGLAFLNYRLRGDVISLDHAEVPSALRGAGVAGPFVKAVLDDVRRRSLHMVPRCGYVAAYVHRHPEYSDLVARAP